MDMATVAVAGFFDDGTSVNLASEYHRHLWSAKECGYLCCL